MECRKIMKCCYTGVELTEETMVTVGPILPNISHLKLKFYLHKDAMPLHKQSIKWFHESEANCNTCKHLERIKHAKDKAGFLYGKCKVESSESQLYKRDDMLMFHPEDPMHMNCYEVRS